MITAPCITPRYGVTQDALRAATSHPVPAAGSDRRMDSDHRAELQAAVRAVGGPSAAARITGMSARQMRRWAAGAVTRPRRREALTALANVLAARTARRARVEEARRRVLRARPASDGIVPAQRSSSDAPALRPPAAVTVPPCQGSRDWDLEGGRYRAWALALQTCATCPLLDACETYRQDAFPGSAPVGVIWAGVAYSPRRGLPMTHVSLRQLATAQLTKQARDTARAAPDVAEAEPAAAGVEVDALSHLSVVAA